MALNISVTSSWAAACGDIGNVSSDVPFLYNGQNHRQALFVKGGDPDAAIFVQWFLVHITQRVLELTYLVDVQVRGQDDITGELFNG